MNWYVSTINEDSDWVDIRNSEHSLIASAYCQRPEDNIITAKLIAKAPELLEALRELCFNIDTEIASGPLMEAYNKAKKLL